MTSLWDLDHGPLAAQVKQLAGPRMDPVDAVAPTRFLPQLLDLGGSVALAGSLATEPVPREAHADGREVVDWVDAQLEALERRHLEVLTGRCRVSSPTRMKRELRGIVPRNPSAVRLITPAFSQHFQVNYVNLRAALAMLRMEAGPRIAALGRRGARLEALDAALADAVAVKAEVLRNRLVAAVHARFAQEAKRALETLPENYRVTDLDPWFDPSGWIPAHLVFVGQTLAAVLAHEAGRLRALARASSDPILVPGRSS
ncbi:MAG: hypothetical protein ACO3JL_17725 [Myxococcota bacterium]